ncbi:hypothetical protein O3M35_010051 [Rhynocoris fuscipes]|uniref:Uncharacterized protein n=1 Tax=Rhynocoris fuscipes TaxID=488301 RepID=A0AAW1CYG5_9HEMI
MSRRGNKILQNIVSICEECSGSEEDENEEIQDEDEIEILESDETRIEPVIALVNARVRVHDQKSTTITTLLPMLSTNHVKLQLILSSEKKNQKIL